MDRHVSISAADGSLGAQKMCKPGSCAQAFGGGCEAVGWFASQTQHRRALYRLAAAGVELFRGSQNAQWDYCSSMVRNIIPASVISGGLLAVLIFPAFRASAYCDAVDCVPNVARNVAPGAPCDPQRMYVFGLGSDSKTYVCTTTGNWASAGPLVGLREVALPCGVLNDSAQQPDGSPLRCGQVNATLRWVFRDDTPA
jgi:hypothetical protein